MLGRILVAATFFSGLAAAETLVVPIDQLFLNLPVFDQVTVVLTSSGAAFANSSPVYVAGPGTENWSSSYVTDQQAMANGPDLTGLDNLKLNLASQTEPVKLLVRFLYRGGQVGTVQLAYDGTAWSYSAVTPNGTSSGIVFDSGTDPGSGGSGPTGGNPTGPTGPTGPGGNQTPGNTNAPATPEPSFALITGLLAAAFAVSRRR
jgi:hypothetical protein